MNILMRQSLFSVLLFIMEDTILHFALIIVPENSYFLSLIVKMGIIFSLKPINGAVEKYLLNGLIKKRKTEVLDMVSAA